MAEDRQGNEVGGWVVWGDVNGRAPVRDLPPLVVSIAFQFRCPTHGRRRWACYRLAGARLWLDKRLVPGKGRGEDVVLPSEEEFGRAGVEYRAAVAALCRHRSEDDLRSDRGAR